MQRHTRRARPRGLTLIGTCAALAIAGVLTMTTLRLVQHAHSGRRRRRAVSGTAWWPALCEERGSARNQGVRLSFYESRAGGCYLVHTGNRSTAGGRQRFAALQQRRRSVRPSSRRPANRCS